MKFEDCRLPPRSVKVDALKVGDIVEALMKQDGDAIFGWQKAKIKELRVILALLIKFQMGLSNEISENYFAKLWKSGTVL